MTAIGRHLGPRQRFIAHASEVRFSKWLNERPLPCADLLNGHDVARMTRRPLWALTLLALTGRFPLKARFRGRPVGWLRQDILDWMAGQLHLSASAVTTREARIPPSSPRPCSRSCIRREEGCSTRLRTKRVFTQSARASDTETSA